jgi:hypothetical protein
MPCDFKRLYRHPRITLALLVGQLLKLCQSCLYIGTVALHVLPPWMHHFLQHPKLRPLLLCNIVLVQPLLLLLESIPKKERKEKY